MRHRFRPRTTGPWHGVPLRVRARQRFAKCIGKGFRMGLSSTLVWDPPPRGTMSDVADNRLPAVVNVNMLHHDALLSTGTVSLDDAGLTETCMWLVVF